MDIDFKIKLFTLTWKISISRQWVRFAIVVIAILSSTIASYWGSRQMFLLFLVLLGGIVGMVTLLKGPNLGFILIFLGGMFVPAIGPSGLNAAVVMVAFLLVLWILDMLVVKRYFQFVRSRVLLPVILFIIISVLAFGMGQIPWFLFANQAPLDAQVGGFIIYLLSAGALIFTAHRIRDERWLQIIVWTFIGLGAIYVLGRLLGFSPTDLIYKRGFSANSMFWTWLVVLALSQAIFNNRLKIRFRILLFCIVLATFFVALVQAYDWKSGWVPPLVGVAVLLGIRYKKIAVFAIPFAVIVGTYLVTKQVASDEYSWGTRVDAWIIVLEISRASPLLGLGFSNYYWYTPLFPIRGWVVVFNSHSQYVDLIAQTGILGLVCFLWIFFEVGKLSWRLSNQLPRGFAQSYAYGILAGIAGTLVAAFLVDWVLPFVYNIGFNGFRASILPWIFFGGVISIEQIYLAKQNTDPASLRGT